MVTHCNFRQNTEHSFDGKGMEVTSELKLTNLTHRDIGSYQCIVDNVYGATYSSKAEITVYVFPQFVLTPEDKTVTGGASVSLQCSAAGVPHPDISWQKDSGSDFPAARERRMHVEADTSTYVISNVQASASKSSIRRFVITEKAPTRASSWLKAATTAFTFKTLLRHYAKQAKDYRTGYYY